MRAARRIARIETPHRQAPDHQRLGLSPNRVGHVDDAGNEDGEQDVVLELFLERADDRGGSHCPGQSDEEPRQAMPEPPAHVLLGRIAKVLHEELGIRHGLMATVHAYTSDQMLQDARTRTCAGRAPRR